MGKKPDYNKWLNIREAKNENPNLRVRDLQSQFHTSPNVVMRALRYTRDEIETKMQNDIRYRPVEFGNVVTKIVSRELVSSNGVVRLEKFVKDRPREEDIEIAKTWIDQVFDITRVDDLDLRPALFDEQKSKPFYIESSSYGMKHWMERDLQTCFPGNWSWKGTYVDNGTFIVAMLDSGFEARVSDEFGSPNVFFNVNPSGFFNALGQTQVLRGDGSPHMFYPELNVIRVHNADGLCSDATCGKPATHYVSMNVGKPDVADFAGKVMVPFCVRHGGYFEGVLTATWHKYFDTSNPI